MFRAAKALQRGGTSLSRSSRVQYLSLRSSLQSQQRVPGSCSVDAKSCDDTTLPATTTGNDCHYGRQKRFHHINANQLLRSVYHGGQSTARNDNHNHTSSSFRRFIGVLPSSSLVARRGFATSAGSDGNDDSTTSSFDSDVDATLDRLFRENEIVQGGGEVGAADGVGVPMDGSMIESAVSGLEFVPAWYNPPDWCIRMILQVDQLTGLENEIGVAIIGTTLMMRLLLFPLVARGQKAASRMAHLSPELKQLQKKYERAAARGGTPSMEARAKMGDEVTALFKRYDTHPVKSMATPLIQLPFMMGMFFGLKKMPDYFPDQFVDGGMLWFTDLSVPDPTYIMPAICAASFFVTVEMGKEQMVASNPDGAKTMIPVMRGLALVMAGVASTFDAGLVLYFTVTNTFTVLQMGFLKVPAVRSYFDIWDPPKPIPGGALGGGGGGDEGLFEAGKKMMEKVQGTVVDEETKIRRHNEMIEKQKRMSDLSKKRRERRRRGIKKRDA